MVKAILQYKWLIVGAIVLVGIVIFLSTKNGESTLLTTTVERGDVRETVSVSGFVEAVQSADLGFPATGRVSGIFVKEGDVVEAGDLLATLGSGSLAAERQRLSANLASAVAAQSEVQNGPTGEARAVTQSTIDQARTALQQTTATELLKVRNALVALRSSNLAAYTLDEEENAPAPTISGSYTCAEEGTYGLEIYRSSTDSGYSFRISGLETGNYTVSYDQPTPFGDCGLLIQFTTAGSYANSEWTIDIPNTRSSSYLTLKNTYELATEQATQNIAAARSALTLAEDQGSSANAAPRIEALLQANASVIAAQAALAGVDASLLDSSILAPFAGIITSVDINEGEVARNTPALKLLGNDSFTITARIPEIDIIKINPGQPVALTFDAKSSDVLSGTVEFVSPIATEIDGVGYFETKIILNETPNWLRAGLNADIDIVITEQKNTLRIPSRYLTTTAEGTFVQAIINDLIATTSVDVGLLGNDGYTEITNLTEGTTIVAP